MSTDRVREMLHGYLSCGECKPQYLEPLLIACAEAIIERDDGASDRRRHPATYEPVGCPTPGACSCPEPASELGTGLPRIKVDVKPPAVKPPRAPAPEQRRAATELTADDVEWIDQPDGGKGTE